MVGFAAPMSGRRAAALTEWLFAGLAAAALLWLSDLLVPSARAPFPGHGERFAAMAAAPLAFDGAFPQRLLWPLLAHAAGWLGVTPVGCSQLANGALLAVVCWFARRRGLPWPEALLVTACLAASDLVLVYKPMACFSDPLNLLLLVLCVHHAGRPLVFWGLVLLASFSHELVFHFAPWLWWLRCRAGGLPVREALAAAAVLAAHLSWRVLVAAAGSGAYDARYYLENAIWLPWGLPALWGLWALAVLAGFGPLLVAVVRALARGEHGLGGRTGAWLFLAAVLSLMVLAYDVMRFAAFVGVPLLLGAVALARSRRGAAILVGLLAAQLVSWPWLHPAPDQPGGAGLWQVWPAAMALLGDGHGIDTPARALAFAAALLQRTAGVWWSAAGYAAAITALGLWLARYANPDGGAPRTMRNASA